MITVAGTKPLLGPFLLRLILASAVLFTTWYACARFVAAPAVWAAARLVETATAIDRVTHSTSSKGQAIYAVEPDFETLRRGRLPRGAVVDVPVNPLKHLFGLPFFLALMLASRAPRGIEKAAVGSLVVFAGSAVGLACELLVQLDSMRSPTGEPVFAFNGRELIAMGFQLGTLIFPTVVPAMLWLAMNPSMVHALPRRGAHESDYPPT